MNIAEILERQRRSVAKATRELATLETLMQGLPDCVDYRQISDTAVYSDVRVSIDVAELQDVASIVELFPPVPLYLAKGQSTTFIPVAVWEASEKYQKQHDRVTDVFPVVLHASHMFRYGSTLRAEWHGCIGDTGRTAMVCVETKNTHAHVRFDGKQQTSEDRIVGESFSHSFLGPNVINWMSGGEQYYKPRSLWWNLAPMVKTDDWWRDDLLQYVLHLNPETFGMWRGN